MKVGNTKAVKMSISVKKKISQRTHKIKGYKITTYT